MSLKKYIALLVLLILMISALPLAAAAAEQPGEDVKAMLAELPDLDTLKTMSPEEQRLAYDQVQAAYDVYLALPAEDRSALEGAEEAFQELFAYFNTLVMPLEETASAEEPTEEKKGMPWAYTALLLALVTTFLQNRFIFNRRR